jgi:hypothetical protein
VRKTVSLHSFEALTFLHPSNVFIWRQWWMIFIHVIWINIKKIKNKKLCVHFTAYRQHRGYSIEIKHLAKGCIELTETDRLMKPRLEPRSYWNQSGSPSVKLPSLLLLFLCHKLCHGKHCIDASDITYLICNNINNCSSSWLPINIFFRQT